SATHDSGRATVPAAGPGVQRSVDDEKYARRGASGSCCTGGPSCGEDEGGPGPANPKSEAAAVEARPVVGDEDLVPLLDRGWHHAPRSRVLGVDGAPHPSALTH